MPTQLPPSSKNIHRKRSYTLDKLWLVDTFTAAAISQALSLGE